MSASVLNKHCLLTMDLKRSNNDLQSLNKERKENECSSCEVVLLTNGIKHFAHKTVLVSNSDFFRKYFEPKGRSFEQTKRKCVKSNEDNSTSSNYESSESSDYILKLSQIKAKTTICLPGIKPAELSRILEYMYTSKLTLTAENVNEILLVACFLQITAVIEFCAEVLTKRPNWRSPLVSTKLSKFAKNEYSKQCAISGNMVNIHGDSPTSSTAVRDARTINFESEITPPLSNGIFSSSNTGIKNMAEVKVAQRKQQTRNWSRCLQDKQLKNRQHLTSSEYDNTKRKKIPEVTKPRPTAEYNFWDSEKDNTIDCKELSRELMESYRVKNLNQESLPSMQSPYIFTPNTIYTEKLSNLHKLQQINLKSNMVLSNRNFHRSQNNYLNPIFLTANGYGQKFAAAYAPAFGIPIIPPEYFGFPIMETRGSYFPESLQNPGISCAMESDETNLIPVSRFPASALHVQPEKVHVDVSYPSPEMLINKRCAYHATPNTQSYKNPIISDVDRACAKSLVNLTRRHIVKQFCSGIVPSQNFDEMNNLESLELHHRSIHQKDTIPRGFKSSYESKPHLVVKTATCDASVTTNNKADTKTDMPMNYSTRKRKLLASKRLVTERDTDDRTIQEGKTPKIFIKDIHEKQKISEKTFIKKAKIERKCHESKVSYPESDDSGRHSSI